MYRYLFIALLGGVGGYCWGLSDGAQIVITAASYGGL